MTTDQPATRLNIWCTACEDTVHSRLTTGSEIYPHRPDLSAIPFWRCPTCHNYVGCHHKTPDPTKPLGCISTPELRSLRSRIHSVLDPLWRGAKPLLSREAIYTELSTVLGRQYHTAELRTLTEARAIHRAACDIAARVKSPKHESTTRSMKANPSLQHEPDGTPTLAGIPGPSAESLEQPGGSPISSTQKGYLLADDQLATYRDDDPSRIKNLHPKIQISVQW